MSKTRLKNSFSPEIHEAVNDFADDIGKFGVMVFKAAAAAKVFKASSIADSMQKDVGVVKIAYAKVNQVLRRETSFELPPLS